MTCPYILNLVTNPYRKPFVIYILIFACHIYGKKINIFFSRNFFVKFVIISAVSYSVKPTQEFDYLSVFLCVPLKFDILLGKALIESVFVRVSLFPWGNATVFPSRLADRM